MWKTRLAKLNAFVHSRDTESTDAHSGQRRRDGGVTMTVGIGLDDGEDVAPFRYPLADLIQVMALGGNVNNRDL
jgi:hypothetical protein